MSILASFDSLVEIAARKGVPLPSNLELFSYPDAPLFHSIVVATSGLVLTPTQCDQVVDFALTLDSSTRVDLINVFALGLLAG